MKAIVIYDSGSGNTEKVAEAIAEGMRGAGLTDLTVLWMRQASEDDFRDRDLWVVGSPTHWGGPTFRTRSLLSNAIKYEGKGKRAAVFDTRYEGFHTGAANKLQVILEKGGVKVIAGPEAFPVYNGRGPLKEGWIERAKLFGQEIVARSR